jgi:hypothetical protein
LSAVKISFQAKPSSKNIVARQNRAEHRVQADGLPRSVSRLFSARRHFPVSLVGSRGNPPANANRSALRVNRFFVVRLSLKLAYKPQAIKLFKFLAFGFFCKISQLQTFYGNSKLEQ